MQAPDPETLRPVLEAVMEIEDPMQRIAFIGAADLLLGLDRPIEKLAADLGVTVEAATKAYGNGVTVGASVVAVAGAALASMQVSPDASAEELLAAMGMGSEAPSDAASDAAPEATTH